MHGTAVLRKAGFVPGDLVTQKVAKGAFPSVSDLKKIELCEKDQDGVWTAILGTSAPAIAMGAPSGQVKVKMDLLVKDYEKTEAKRCEAEDPQWKEGESRTKGKQHLASKTSATVLMFALQLQDGALVGDERELLNVFNKPGPHVKAKSLRGGFPGAPCCD